MLNKFFLFKTALYIFLLAMAPACSKQGGDPVTGSETDSVSADAQKNDSKPLSFLDHLIAAKQYAEQAQQILEHLGKEKNGGFNLGTSISKAGAEIEDIVNSVTSDEKIKAFFALTTPISQNDHNSVVAQAQAKIANSQSVYNYGDSVITAGTEEVETAETGKSQAQILENQQMNRTLQSATATQTLLQQAQTKADYMQANLNNLSVSDLLSGYQQLLALVNSFEVSNNSLSLTTTSFEQTTNQIEVANNAIKNSAQSGNFNTAQVSAEFTSLFNALNLAGMKTQIDANNQNLLSQIGELAATISQLNGTISELEETISGIEEGPYAEINKQIERLNGAFDILTTVISNAKIDQATKEDLATVKSLLGLSVESLVAANADLFGRLQTQRQILGEQKATLTQQQTLNASLGQIGTKYLLLSGQLAGKQTELQGKIALIQTLLTSINVDLAEITRATGIITNAITLQRQAISIQKSLIAANKVNIANLKVILQNIEALFSICTRADLDRLRNNPVGNYTLTCDINLEGAAWEPIQNFYGTLNGLGHTISNMRVEKTVADGDGGAFISRLNSATVSNLRFENAYVKVVSGGAGILAVSGGSAKIRDVRVSGYVEYTADTALAAGGIVAAMSGVNAEITNSSAIAEVKGAYNVGGLVGFMNSGRIADSYACAKLTGLNRNGEGGIAGGIWNSTIERVFAKVSAPNNTDYRLGGIVGLVEMNYTIRNAYAIGSTGWGTQVIGASDFTNSVYRGVIENVYGSVNAELGFIWQVLDFPQNLTVTHSYFDKSKSPFDGGLAGTGLTPAQMLNQNNFVGWDFANLWQMGASGPVLRQFAGVVCPN